MIAGPRALVMRIAPTALAVYRSPPRGWSPACRPVPRRIAPVARGTLFCVGSSLPLHHRLLTAISLSFPRPLLHALVLSIHHEGTGSVHWFRKQRIHPIKRSRRSDGKRF